MAQTKELAAERKDVLLGLRKLGNEVRTLQKERDRQDKAIRVALMALLARGRAAGVQVTSMAESYDATRQWIHLRLRELP
jgi:hypothetical protein